MARFWQFDRHPQGNDFASAFSFRDGPPQPLADGEVRVRVRWLSMDAGTRMWIGPRTDGYQPPLSPGSRMVGLVLGDVIETRAASFPIGTMVRGFGQWAEESVMVPADAGLVAVNAAVDDPRQHLGALGLNGWTALAGVRDVARIQPGETLLVSAAAGATGSLACQIGKLLGATVIGIAGGSEKCRYLRDRLNVDLAIDHRAGNVAAQLASVEGGINAYFDNVGGPMLDAVLPAMAHYGRVAICGMVAGYDQDGPLPGPRHFDQVLMRRLRIEGFFIPDLLDQGPDYDRQLRAWHDAGKLDLAIDETVGLEHALDAYHRIFDGRNIGKVLVKVAA